MRLTRRDFLIGSSAVAGLACTRRLEVAAGSAASTLAPPPELPLAAYQQGFENWAGDIVVEALWTCCARSAADLVTLANWAADHGWTLRPRGKMHNWSPLSVDPGGDLARVLMVDTTQHLTAMTMLPGAVRVEAGATMEDLLAFLESHGKGIIAHPAPGDITVGGALAIDGHGTAIPAAGETPTAGTTYGSLSNLVLSLTAVVGDGAGYALRTFTRGEPDTKAFLTHLGRALVTEVVLAVGPLRSLRCQSFLDIPATELFAASAGARSLAAFLEQSGRVEAIWFPFTANPWLKVWTVAPRKPLLARPTNHPYNYLFADAIPKLVSDLADEIISGNGAATPIFGAAEYDATLAGLTALLAYDLWGAAKNTMLYVRATTLRVTANGYAVLCRRADIQRVVHELAAVYQAKLATYRAAGSYPMNGPVEIRVTGLDHPADVGVAGAESPALSALRPIEAHPEWDVAVWFDILTFPGTPLADTFYAEIEAWIYANYSGYCAVRVEWSKGWGYSDAGAWTNLDRARAALPTWDWAAATLAAHDPAGLFSNALLDRLF